MGVGAITLTLTVGSCWRSSLEDSDASLEEGEEASTRFNSGTPVDGQWRQILQAYFVQFRDNSKAQKNPMHSAENPS